MKTIPSITLVVLLVRTSLASFQVDLLPVCEAPFGVVLETIDLDPARDGALTCSLMCTQNQQCRSILFNQLDNRCVLNSQREVVNWTACGVPDSLYAPIPRLTTIGESCIVDNDCVDVNSTCQDGICWCVPGLSHQESTHACYESCPNGYGDTYQETLAHVIWGFSDRTVFGNVEECKAACIAETSFVCRHVEYWLDVNYQECYLSSYTAITADAVNPGAFRADIEYNLYHRDCV